MTTLDQIQILPENESLTGYTHCVSRSAAESLAADIAEIEAQGFKVITARSYRCAVPQSYRSAYKMHAPYYVFDGKWREIVLVDGALENRPKGATIPARFVVAGQTVPDGFRCFERGENYVVVRKK
jgi:hypothetical protein